MIDSDNYPKRNLSLFISRVSIQIQISQRRYSNGSLDVASLATARREEMP